MMKTNEGMIIDFDVVLPSEGQKLTVYADFLLKLQTRQNFFSRNLGYSSWLQGKVLNMARKKCKRGKWGKFLATIEVAPGKTLKPGTARLCRRIADLVEESQAKKKTFTEMLAMVYPSFARELKNDAESETPTLTRKRKGQKRPLGKSKAPLHPDRYQAKLRRILSESQSLGSGLEEIGAKPTDEIDHCRECIRLADSAINELQGVKTVCQAAIDKYPTHNRKAAA